MSRQAAACVVCWAMATLTGANAGGLELKMTKDGGVAVLGETYQARVGPTGCLESIRAGGTEFLRDEPTLTSGSGVIDHVQPGYFGVLHKELTFEKLNGPSIKGQTVTAVGPKTTLTYRFRGADFDVLAKGKERRGHYLLLPSQHVVRSLDVETDKPVRLPEDAAVWWSQEGMRWFTRQGPVLMMTERVDGYTSCSWWSHRWANKTNYPAPGVSLRIAQYPMKYTFRPVPTPAPVEAIGFTIQSEHSDFLLPGGQPARFNIQATNLTRTRQSTGVDFEVREYCTRRTVGRTSTQVALEPGASQAVRAHVELQAPGPYRGAIAVKDTDKTLREIAWVFVYDFPNYTPESTRQPDFKAFWKDTLDELARVPMEPKLKLKPEWSNDTHEVYEVSLATLNQERFWAWYSKPRAPGKYPAIYRCPPTGPFHPPADQSNRSTGPYVHFYIAAHGFDLYLSDRDPANKDDPRNRYHTAGIESHHTSRWRVIFASLARGMDFLRSRPEVDPRRIAVTGSSQGGGLSIVLAGLQPDVACCLPTCAGLCRLDWTVLHQAGYWPFRASARPAGQTMEQFLKTISYFDAANFAPDIRCPVVAHCQLLDWVTTSGGQIDAFAHLGPGQVEVIGVPWEGHGGYTTESASRYRHAMSLFLKGQAPVVRPSK